jgi:hypothetical protein
MRDFVKQRYNHDWNNHRSQCQRTILSQNAQYDQPTPNASINEATPAVSWGAFFSLV